MTTSTIAAPAASTRRRVDTKPWYRQFWLWFLVALPVASVGLSFFTLYKALSGVDDVVPHEGDSTSYSAPHAPASTGGVREGSEAPAVATEAKAP